MPSKWTFKNMLHSKPVYFCIFTCQQSVAIQFKMPYCIFTLYIQGKSCVYIVHFIAQRMELEVLQWCKEKEKFFCDCNSNGFSLIHGIISLWIDRVSAPRRLSGRQADGGTTNEQLLSPWPGKRVLEGVEFAVKCFYLEIKYTLGHNQLNGPI